MEMQIHKWQRTSLQAIEQYKHNAEFKAQTRVLPTLLRDMGLLNTYFQVYNKPIGQLLRLEIESFLDCANEDVIEAIHKLNILEVNALQEYCMGFASELKRYANALMKDV